MTNLKLAIFAYNHPESTLPLAKHLARKGHFVDYYFATSCSAQGCSAFSFGRKVWMPGLRLERMKYMSRYYDYMRSDKVRIYLFVLPPYPLRYLHSIAQFQFYAMGLFLKYRKYDYINVVGQNPLLLNLLKPLASHQNVYASLHETCPHYNSQNVDCRLMEYLIQNKINIITHSDALRNRLLEFYNADSNRITKIPFGVFETYSLFDTDNAIAKRLGNYLLFFGNILPYKGLDLLYNAIQSMGNRLGTMKVVVAGAGDDPILQKMANDPRYVLIHRHLSNEEIVALNKNAYCVVCPYKSASQSGIVPTSFLFGKPIIASDVGGMSEYIQNEENGILVRPNDASSLADALLRLMVDKTLHHRLCEGAQKFACSPMFAWDAIAEKYLNLFAHFTRQDCSSV